MKLLNEMEKMVEGRNGANWGIRAFILGINLGLMKLLALPKFSNLHGVPVDDVLVESFKISYLTK